MSTTDTKEYMKGYKDATEYLKQYVDRSKYKNAHPKADELLPKDQTIDSANRYIEERTADSPDVSTVRKKLHKRAQAVGADVDTSEERQKERDIQQALVDAENERRAQSPAIHDRVRQVGDVARSTVGPLADRVGTLPTPGGNGFLIMVLIILLFTVVVVNSHGDTRLKQLWYMLNGRATIAGRQDVTSYNPPSSMGTNGMPATGNNSSGTPQPGNLPIIPFSSANSNNPLDFLPNLNPGF